MIHDGIKTEPRIYSIPKIYSWYFNSWLDISTYASRNNTVAYSNSTGSNLVVNTKGSNITLLMINKYNITNEDQIGIDFIYILPFKEETKTQLINLSNLGKNIINFIIIQVRDCNYFFAK